MFAKKTKKKHTHTEDEVYIASIDVNAFYTLYLCTEIFSNEKYINW